MLFERGNVHQSESEEECPIVIYLFSHCQTGDMQTLGVAISYSSLLNHHHLQTSFLQFGRKRFFSTGEEELARLSSLNPSRGTGICRTSQAVELFPAVCPEVVVREARIEDCWEVAETHCSSFFPNYSFPLDLMLRIDRLVGLLAGFSKPIGCMRTCLVAVVSSQVVDQFFGNADSKFPGFEGKSGFNRGQVAGILTVDTVADFLPRKGPLRQRRTGIAYISNVAVRQQDRRKGIAKKLIAKAEAQARSWGCRAIALHCDANNPAATALYRGQGFRCIMVPADANWPQPKTAPGGGRCGSSHEMYTRPAIAALDRFSFAIALKNWGSFCSNTELSTKGSVQYSLVQVGIVSRSRNRSKKWKRYEEAMQESDVQMWVFVGKIFVSEYVS